MNSMQQHDPSGHKAELPSFLGSIHLEMLGWREIERRRETGIWQDVDGDFLGLVRIQGGLGLPPLRDEDGVTRHCGMMAESMESRLVEAAVVDHIDGRAVMFVCRRLRNWALESIGILMIPTRRASWVWSMTAMGHSATGDLRYLCEDCLCPAHPLSRVRQELRKLLTVRLDA